MTAARALPAPAALDCGGELAFELPDGLVATGPPEARGVPRDGVRMLVASAAEGLAHRRAYHLPAVLRPGDLLVLNTSDTLPAALRGVTSTGAPVEVHLSTVDPDAGWTPARALAGSASDWVVEIREPDGRPGGAPSAADRAGTTIRLAGGGRLDVHGPYPDPTAPARLWTARLATPEPLRAWLTAHGQPIRYGYVSGPWPLAAYRTGYADTPGSAEMPSAGRPLTARTFRRLRARGVRTAGLVLHCGVSSLEAGEPPYREWYAVPQSTMDEVAAVRRDGGRVIAVGTTVVRALESVAGSGPAGWTDLVITPDRGVSTVDGLITGWHPPEASHLQLLSAVAGPELLCASYRAALAGGYRWHEFGDLHLILP
ncbi:MAG TPA: S-adenosylmethionine:tRNA ribosyltransferase-isomerase [Mycobacteriales bacterium]|nr:S-adenosylmethionine:tRNA ribosyltransferase-isomerase [Mycobacteriales bacterium]